MESMIFNSECTRNRLCQRVHNTPQTPSWIWGRDLQGHEMDTKGREGREREKEGWWGLREEQRGERGQWMTSAYFLDKNYFLVESDYLNGKLPDNISS